MQQSRTLWGEWLNREECCLCSRRKAEDHRFCTLLWGSSLSITSMNTFRVYSMWHTLSLKSGCLPLSWLHILFWWHTAAANVHITKRRSLDNRCGGRLQMELKQTWAHGDGSASFFASLYQQADSLRFNSILLFTEDLFFWASLIFLISLDLAL